MAEIGWAAALGLLGAIVGSFAATLVIRWPQGRSVVDGRSRCDACDRTLSPVELVPLLSAVWLRGRCRGCRTRIDPRHGAIEALCAGVGVSAGLAAGGPAAAAGAVFGWLLVALAALDLAEWWLPDALILPLAATGVAAGLAGVPPATPDRLIGGIVGFLSLWLIAAGYRLSRGRDGMGGGDPKLFGAIGAWLGWALLPAVLLLAALGGLAVVVLRRVRGRQVTGDDMLPLGTLLAVAAYPAWIILLWLRR